jgi:hypothetical protein
MRAMTMPGMTHWMTVGRRHAQEEPGKFLSVPYVVQPAIMFPTHQTIVISAFMSVMVNYPSGSLQLLYIPAIVPR